MEGYKSLIAVAGTVLGIGCASDYPVVTHMSYAEADGSAQKNKIDASDKGVTSVCDKIADPDLILVRDAARAQLTRIVAMMNANKEKLSKVPLGGQGMTLTSGAEVRLDDCQFAQISVDMMNERGAYMNVKTEQSSGGFGIGAYPPNNSDLCMQISNDTVISGQCNPSANDIQDRVYTSIDLPCNGTEATLSRSAAQHGEWFGDPEKKVPMDQVLLLKKCLEDEVDQAVAPLNQY